MQYDDIRLTLLQIFSFPKNKEKYLTAEQICNNIKEYFPYVWQEINSSFPNLFDYPQIINQYTPLNFVTKALEYYSNNNGIPGLEQEESNLNKTNNTTGTITTWRLRKF